MVLALLAALSMVVQDVLMTLMVVCENRGRWVLAGLLDCVGWIAQISTITIAGGSIIEHGLTPESWLIIIFVTIANFVGTGLGTVIGRHIKTTELTKVQHARTHRFFGRRPRGDASLLHK